MATCKKCVFYKNCNKNGTTEYMGTDISSDSVEKLCKNFISRCPICTSNMVVKGCGYKLHTPKIIKWIRSSHGVTCVLCGHSRSTIKRWNKEGADNENNI